MISDLCLVTPSVPAAVSSLKLDNNGSSRSLQASWLSAEGGVDSYLLALSALGTPTQERSLTPNITQVYRWDALLKNAFPFPQVRVVTSEINFAQVLFEGLTPGLRYELSVRTRAGGLSSETTASGRTGEC